MRSLALWRSCLDFSRRRGRRSPHDDAAGTDTV